jgi:hypothetical protein
MRALSALIWIFIIAAALGFIAAIVLKLMGGYPVAFNLYPRSFMSFVDTCLFFAITFLLVKILAKKK